jgi:phospholipase C
VTSLTGNSSDTLLPFWLNYAGEDWSNKTQCMNPGSNNWAPTQQAMNNGSMDMWAVHSAPQALGYFKKEDIPYHWSLAEAYTLGDHYTVRTCCCFRAVEVHCDNVNLTWE